MEEAKSRHKKELKALEGEKRSALKKAKSTAGKGKKGKEAMAALESEYTTKEKEMAERHRSELAALAEGGGGSGGADSGEATDGSADGGSASKKVTIVAAAPPPEDPEEVRRREKQNKAQEKARRKREKAKEKERERERQIEEELKNAGPPPREVEISAMRELYLDPAGLTIREVEADGNCLYRAVAEQCPDLLAGGYGEARAACAGALASHEEEFAPFAETHDHGSYEKYVESVRSSSEWGGHLELRALTRALKRTVVVYSAEAVPLRMGEEFADEGEEVRLSFHRRYYALGEHYNSVVPK
uniref:OTU domain-containing protein n=1 Tax=Trieres chinensis TaxID=1514140 RepID=A0A7S2EVU4_TRICV|mmetsp:Transcript_4420/g.9348  ORF Transcript_4420/g.9348 Transcript_4420/m.9348 type:complete len:302 (+) Transcript_4420:104-1009(+)|eukprot:CAMPEP_0183309814 /NCGR_PEP_ID=MMETSP0160_2-20130417/25559_1 /TAXON_ID=2839 ORGANISM="Odontella Sinensis, Strain Grunow 1884" /NCGR_SAMPLE_ID=MMETSP0160_2 /ASSEMBLY_ACC=CAM_ASM_000250 /LENGTH=301 /DNA_ID=CAMNT_0025473893 /DNA_START=93 /DNA_END=998 /DNA_ORIENTATION=-